MSISVIMCIYSEPEEWISKSIMSIIQQDFQDFECIIINDNPQREVNCEILNHYASKESRLKIIHNKENIGLTKSLNIGLSVAKGKYIARMDADDICESNRFQIQYDFMESNLDYVLCGSNVHVINEKGEGTGKDLRIYFSDREIREVFPVFNPMCHPSLFMDRNILTKYGITYNETFRYAQDYELIRELLKYGKVCNLGAKLVRYRKSPNQISLSKFALQHKFANRTRLAYIQDILQVKGYSQQDLYTRLKQVHKNRIVYNSLLSLLINFDMSVNRKEYYGAVLSFKYSLRNSFKLIFRSLK